MTAKAPEAIRKQALRLARENMRAEPGIEAVYWVPDGTEVRLIEVESNTVKTLSERVEPFYFDPSPSEELTAPSGVAVIRPEEFRKLELPEGWGDWDDVEKLEPGE
ncbi:MAG: hypothetical protein ACOCX4_06190 [Planctomycetota bacterium]